MTTFDTNHCLIGDARQTLATLPERSIHCCVTSPPYWGLRDYGVDGQIGLEETPDAYVQALVEVFREVRRVLRDDGTLWLNLGDTYATGAGKSRNPGGDKGKQRGITGKRGGIPASAPNRHHIDGLKAKDLIGIPWMVAFALRSDGWWLRSDIIWSKANPQPESVSDRPTKAHEYVFLLSKSERYFYDAQAIAEPLTRPRSSTAEDAARAFSRKRTHAPRKPQPAAQLAAPTPATRNARDVWTLPSEPYRGAHFACFPRALAQRCILAGCPEGGIVLDPFFGSGTVGQVAQKLGRRWVACDLNPEYERLQRARTAQQGLMFTTDRSA